ncbi:HNH endonuclease [Streptomyces sp. ISL-12]|uniref:HNH endonuclease signature motif containing protein n=1 Tax=Streptomyces sp. ISL-12 TaxID=2819177 RepID=UPI001BEC84CD|nr:HNH endonuclease [Streptomyces sp. ISL-12]
MLWTGSTDQGYGRLRFRGRLVRAHRFSYELNVGPIPDGHQVDHLCRTPSCVRPDHLEAVTQRENVLRGGCTLGAKCASHALYAGPPIRR